MGLIALQKCGLQPLRYAFLSHSTPVTGVGVDSPDTNYLASLSHFGTSFSPSQQLTRQPFRKFRYSSPMRRQDIPKDMKPQMLAILNDIDRITGGISFQSLASNETVLFATQRLIQLIGSTLRFWRVHDRSITSQIPDALRAIEFGKFLVKRYWEVTPEMTWDALHDLIPKIKHQVTFLNSTQL